MKLFLLSIQFFFFSLAVSAADNSTSSDLKWPESICYPAKKASDCVESFEFITADLNFGINNYCISEPWWPMTKKYYPNRLGETITAFGNDGFTPNMEITVREAMQIVCEYSRTYDK